MPFKEESDTKSSLYFHGTYKKGKDITIHKQPTFFDALQLIKPQHSKPYQRIPLRKATSLIFEYTDNFVKKTIQCKIDLLNGAIHFKKSEDAKHHRLLSSFLIKEGNRVTYLANKPNTPEKAKIKNQPPSPVKYKWIED